MSRCFPFPPPGYEKKTRDEHIHLLAENGKMLERRWEVTTNNANFPLFQKTKRNEENGSKEKRKEKKHKKEKKKEKREGKEKKEKDRSKDKHKEKKDRKEKHKDKKKRDKDKDKSKTPYDKPDKQSHPAHGDAPGECSRKTEEIEHSKFKEELDRRIKDEEKVAAHRKVEKISSPVQKSIGSMGSAIAMANKKPAIDNIFSTTACTQRKIDGLDRSADKFVISSQRRNEGLVSANVGQKDRITGEKLVSTAEKFSISTQGRSEGLVSANVAQRTQSTSNKLVQATDKFSVSATAVQKERSASDKLVPKLTSAGQKGNGGMSLPMENSVAPLRKGFEDPFTSNLLEIDKHKTNKISSNSNSAAQRTINGMAQSAQSLSNHKQIGSTGTPIKMEDREVNRSAPNHSHMVAKKIDRMGQSVDKNANNRSVEGKAKSEREADDRREERYKDRDHDQKKIKDKDKRKGEEKEEKAKQKGEQQQIGLSEPRDERTKGQLDSLKLKPLAPQTDNTKNNLIDGSVKKRKETDMNGFLNESSMRPNKVPRTNLSTQLREENGRTLEPSHISIAFPSLKPEGINKTASRKAICNELTNGILEARTSLAGLMQPAAAEKSGVTGKVPKAPHPDAVYLDQIYSIPKVEEYPEYDDQEWLFSSSNLQKTKSKLGDEEIPPVWSQAIRIESEDVVALPYVVPF